MEALYLSALFQSKIWGRFQPCTGSSTQRTGHIAFRCLADVDLWRNGNNLTALGLARASCHHSDVSWYGTSTFSLEGQGSCGWLVASTACFPWSLMLNHKWNCHSTWCYIPPQFSTKPPAAKGGFYRVLITKAWPWRNRPRVGPVGPRCSDQARGNNKWSSEELWPI